MKGKITIGMQSRGKNTMALIFIDVSSSLQA
jgi:hypothetical protein